jgi:hypothetical protein
MAALASMGADPGLLAFLSQFDNSESTKTPLPVVSELSSSYVVVVSPLPLPRLSHTHVHIHLTPVSEANSRCAYSCVRARVCAWLQCGETV